MSANIPVAASPSQPPRLLDQFRTAARAAGHPETCIEPSAPSSAFRETVTPGVLSLLDQLASSATAV